MSIKLFAFFLLISFSLCLKSKSLAKSESQGPVCTDAECVIYDVSNQAACTTPFTEAKPRPATFDVRWHESFNSNADYKVLGGKIVAYKIRWFNGTWSGWYVPGVNDLDWKFYTKNGNKFLRRLWAYFSDHQHMYIICA